MPEIVPVELTLPSGTWFTLHQRGWQDADDDSLAFLGTATAVYAFRTPDELASYATSTDVGSLSRSTLWAEVRRRPRRSFVPAESERFDLQEPTARTREMLAELLVHLDIEPPEGDWLAEPLASLIPTGMSVYGLPLGVPDPRPTGGMTVWEWLVTEVDGHVGLPHPGQPGVLAPAEPGGIVESPEDVAGTVEVLWLGLHGNGVHTLVSRSDDGWSFLGRPGELLGAETTEALARFLRHGDAPVLDEPPWSSLRGHDHLDLEPYEDNVLDMDELGAALRRDVDLEVGRQEAEALLAAAALLRELASWLHLDTVAFAEDQPLGRFLVRDLLDVVGGRRQTRLRLTDIDVDAVCTAWDECVTRIAAGVTWVD